MMDFSAATTDEIAENIRARIIAQPGPAIAWAPGVDRLVEFITDRLPYIDADDLGAVLLFVGCYAGDWTETLRGPGGMSADAATQMVTNSIVLAGERLYTAGQQAARDRRSGGGR